MKHSETMKSCEVMGDGEEVEGDEDWRYGPLGRAGVYKDAEAPTKADSNRAQRLAELKK